MFKITFRAFALLPLLAAFAAGAQELTMLTEENPPFNFTENGKLTGMSTDVLAEMSRRAKVPAKFEMRAWGDAYEAAQKQSSTCIYSTARLENRERIFKWAGPIATDTWGLFAKSGFKDEIRTLADARSYRIGGVLNDAKVEWLKQNAVTNIVTVREDKLIPPMLTLNRKQLNAADLWVVGVYAGKTIAARANAGDIKLVLKIKEERMWLACNPAVANSTIKALAQALADMKKDGTYVKITQAYEKRFAP